MKIEKPTTAPASLPSEGKAPHGAAQKTAPAPQPAVDKVDLTAASAQMAASAGMHDTGVMNTERIEAIKQAIREGRFTVNTNAVADRLISSVQELVLSRKG